MSRPEQIAKAMHQRIVGGELREGDKLPAENALSRHFGVSRAVIREAIARLKAEGLVESFQGSGAFVRSPSALHDELDPAIRASRTALLDLIDVRRVIDAEIAMAAARNRGPADLARIEQALAALHEADRRNEDGVAEDCAFHQAIAAASGNVYWKMLVGSLARNVAIGIRVTRVNEASRRDFSAEVRAEHDAIFAAIRDGDVKAAGQAAIGHMEGAAARILSAEQDFWKGRGAAVRDLGE